jgi:hypothetical protein
MRSVFFGILTLNTLCSGVAFAVDSEDPKNIIAAQIRDQGYACDNPKSAKRDPSLSQGEDTGWILDCGDATYQVKLVPDMAATVKKIDQNDKKPDQQDQKD